MKMCKKCKLELPITKFGKNSSLKSGISNICKLCEAERKRLKYNSSNEVRISKIKQRYDYDIERKYGITPNEYIRLMESQNGCCAICDNPEVIVNKTGELRMLCVDHHHETGEIRGLLCHKCNYGLGIYNDNSELLMKASLYLSEHKMRREISE